MVEYHLKLTGVITELLNDGFVCEGKDGLTKIRDKIAFKNGSLFTKGQRVRISFQNILDPVYYESVVKHSTKTWFFKNGVMIVGAINSNGDNAICLKELKEGESPFQRKFFFSERSWISNDKYLEDIPTACGDVLQVDIRVIDDENIQGPEIVA